MPEITISEELHRQIQAEAETDDVEEALWRMVGSYRRVHNPESDTGAE